MEITIEMKLDEQNKEREYFISDTSTEATTAITVSYTHLTLPTKA